MNKNEITTKRLTLRAFRDSDQSAVVSILTNRDVSKTYMLPDFPAISDAIPLFQRLKTLSADPDRYVFGIDVNGEIVGFMNEVERDGDSIEIGYVVHPDHQNHGYATEALIALISHLHFKGFQTVTAGYFAENIASRRVMEKAGMQLTDREDEIEYRGNTHRCHYFISTVRN